MSRGFRICATGRRHIQDMEHTDWISFQMMDGVGPAESDVEDFMYTLYAPDFWDIPEIDFAQLAMIDPSLHALLN